MERDTVGKLSQEILDAEPNDHSAHDQMAEQLTDYDNNIFLCVEEGKKLFPGDFYVVVMTKKERLMQNVIRNYFRARQSCPTPEWDQIVYKFHRAASTIEFMWVVPAKDICQFFKDNMLLIDKSEHELLKFVIDFEEGTLLNWSKKLNGEIE